MIIALTVRGQCSRCNLPCSTRRAETFNDMPILNPCSISPTLSGLAPGTTGALTGESSVRMESMCALSQSDPTAVHNLQ